jgi:hypothetical protein
MKIFTLFFTLTLFNLSLLAQTENKTTGLSNIESTNSYKVSRVYFSGAVLFTPYVRSVNDILNKNFYLMGLGGALALNFTDHMAIYCRVNSISLNNHMHNVPDGLTSASVKYLHTNVGFTYYIGHGKLQPYAFAGINLLRFTEKGAFEAFSTTNTFYRFGYQIGFGARCKLNRRLGIFTDITYNNDTELPGVYSTYNIHKEDLSNLQLMIGFSLNFIGK